MRKLVGSVREFLLFGAGNAFVSFCHVSPLPCLLGVVSKPKHLNNEAK